jgi:pimeloyl-ACP methyl ester carboxylesterase/predicted glycosyltransferase
MTGVQAPVRPREQTRARYPDASGYTERDGVCVFWERYGDGDSTVLLLPPWSIVHSRVWKMQIPYLARHCRVVTFDPRGNGRSDRPEDPAAYDESEFACDAADVLAATAPGPAFVAGFSLGAQRALLLAAERPELVRGLVLIGAAVPLGLQSDRARAIEQFDRRLPEPQGWDKFNRHYWLEHFEDFLEFFFSRVYVEPHSTKQIEDCVGWGLEIGPEALVAANDGPGIEDERSLREIVGRVHCPVLLVHGSDDQIRAHASGLALAELLEAPLLTLHGSGHAPHARDPVRVNLLLREQVCPRRPRHWTRSRERRRRALYVSSPIGLGHAMRDVAIANELRALHPDLEIDWLAQHPVTAMLEARGERIHPASSMLASESGHMAAEAQQADHELHCFQAWRRMDEILLADFMVFHDVVSDEHYDLWIGDEAWDLDYYLHENPELKTAAYAWLTDFVGWLPMPDGGAHEASLTADYNAEMLEQIARHPGVRDRAVFVGEPEDIVPDTFGPGLPAIRDWTEQHYRFSGYITGFDLAELADRALLRAELGYGLEESVCVVAVGGSGIGADLLGRVIASFPEAKRLIPKLRMIVVAGPRIDPTGLAAEDRLEIRAYVPDLYRHLAACDVAVVQGGLTTTMELTANRRPFIYFPLRQHFEQNFHVAYRLDRFGAGRRMEFDASPPEVIAAAIAEELGREVAYRAVEPGGAARAAAVIAELL